MAREGESGASLMSFARPQRSRPGARAERPDILSRDRPQYCRYRRQYCNGSRCGHQAAPLSGWSAFARSASVPGRRDPQLDARAGAHEESDQPLEREPIKPPVSEVRDPLALSTEQRRGVVAIPAFHERNERAAGRLFQCRDRVSGGHDRTVARLRESRGIARHADGRFSTQPRERAAPSAARAVAILPAVSAVLRAVARRMVPPAIATCEEVSEKSIASRMDSGERTR